MAKDQGVIPTTLRPRAAGRAGAAGGRAAVADAPKRRTSPVQFFREVRAEARKVTWTSWKETWITSVMVGVMVVLASLFFFSVDGVFSFLINFVLKFFGGTGS